MRSKKIDFLYQVSWIFRYLGSPWSSQGGIQWVPQDWGSPADQDLTVAFVGDLMGLGNRTLKLDLELLKWLGHPDWFCLNIEGQLTHKRRLPLVNQVFNSPKVFEDLKNVMPSTKMLASFANNHVGDIDLVDHERFLNLLKSLDFKITGLNGNTPVELASGLSFHAHSAWLGENAERVSRIEELNSPKEQGILFIHHGDEFSLGPNVVQQKFESNLDPKFIALIGHHTHRPAGIEWKKRLVAWSLGNFGTPFGGENVRWGQILKLAFRK